MINEIYVITNDIFEEIRNGVSSDYQAFRSTAELFNGYMLEELSLRNLEGIDATDVDTNYNRAKLANLIESLKKLDDSNDWNKFILSYTNDGEVKIQFEKIDKS